MHLGTAQRSATRHHYHIMALWIDQIMALRSYHLNTKPRTLQVDYLPVPGHCAAVCLSPDGTRLAASIQVPYTIYPSSFKSEGWAEEGSNPA